MIVCLIIFSFQSAQVTTFAQIIQSCWTFLIISPFQKVSRKSFSSQNLCPNVKVIDWSFYSSSSANCIFCCCSVSLLFQFSVVVVAVVLAVIVAGVVVVAIVGRFHVSLMWTKRGLNNPEKEGQPNPNEFWFFCTCLSLPRLVLFSLYKREVILKKKVTLSPEVSSVYFKYKISYLYFT